MKNKIIVIMLIPIIALLLSSCDFVGTKVSIGEIKKFNFSQRNGYNPYGDIIYEIDYEEEIYHAAIKSSNMSDEDILLVELDKEIIDKIRQLLIKYDIGSWNGFSKYDDRVMDGTDFKLYAEFFNGEEIDASGYMMWPNNYHEFRDELTSLFDEIYESNK